MGISPCFALGARVPSSFASERGCSLRGAMDTRSPVMGITGSVYTGLGSFLAVVCSGISSAASRCRTCAAQSWAGKADEEEAVFTEADGVVCAAARVFSRSGAFCQTDALLCRPGAFSRGRFSADEAGATVFLA